MGDDLDTARGVLGGVLAGALILCAVLVLVGCGSHTEARSGAWLCVLCGGAHSEQTHKQNGPDKPARDATSNGDARKEPAEPAGR